MMINRGSPKWYLTNNTVSLGDNPLIQPFYQRLLAAGKPFKVAQCAAARKLLHLAWAVVTKGRPFDPQQGLTA